MLTQVLDELNNYEEFQIDIFESNSEEDYFSIGLYTPSGIYKIEKPGNEKSIYVARGVSHKGEIKWSDAEVELTNAKDLVRIILNKPLTKEK